MSKTDAQLIAEYIDGDERSLAVLVDRYLKDVYTFAVRLTGDLHASEDIAQDAFTKAWKHIRSFRRDRNFRTWIFSITRNTAIDWLRQKRAVAFSAFDNDEGENLLAERLASTELLPDELSMQAEDAKAVQTLLTQLDPRYAEILDLRYKRELSFEEISKLVHRPINTIRSQHRRALAALRALYKAQPA